MKPSPDGKQDKASERLSFAAAKRLLIKYEKNKDDDRRKLDRAGKLMRDHESRGWLHAGADGKFAIGAVAAWADAHAKRYQLPSEIPRSSLAPKNVPTIDQNVFSPPSAPLDPNDGFFWEDDTDPISRQAHEVVKRDNQRREKNRQNAKKRRPRN